MHYERSKMTRFDERRDMSQVPVWEDIDAFILWHSTALADDTSNSSNRPYSASQSKHAVCAFQITCTLPSFTLEEF